MLSPVSINDVATIFYPEFWAFLGNQFLDFFVKFGRFKWF